MTSSSLAQYGPATDRATAEKLDAADPLASFKEEFLIADRKVCYLDGNSLGRLPLATHKAINSFMTLEWGLELVDGWSHWIDEAQPTGNLLGETTLGAAPGQILVCDTTSVNFYQLCVAAVKANPHRKTVIIDAANFPTDRYILAGIAQQFGLNLITLDNDGSGGPGAIEVNSKKELITPELLEPLLNDDVALVTLQVIYYRSGSRSDVKAITDLCRKNGTLVVWDASHAVGAIDLKFDEWGVDLAVGCTYKYLNSGPGSPAWLYVSSRLQAELQVPIQGWFAQDDQFAMGPFFAKNQQIRGYQIASPSIMGLRCVSTSLEMVKRAGIETIAAKAALGTEMMIELFDAWLAPLGFELLTPRDASKRGGHITIGHPEAKRIAAALRKFQKVIPDYRTPDSIRLAIAPMPTSFTEVWDGFARLKELMELEQYNRIEDDGNRVT